MYLAMLMIESRLLRSLDCSLTLVLHLSRTHTHLSPHPHPPLTQVQSTAKDGPDAVEDDDTDGALDEVVVTQQVMHLRAKDIANKDLRSDKKPCKPSPYSIWVSCKDLKASQESNVVRYFFYLCTCPWSRKPTSRLPCYRRLDRSCAAYHCRPLFDCVDSSDQSRCSVGKWEVVLAAVWWLALHREALERAAWRDERREMERESVCIERRKDKAM
jgi:hypothetical protein